jgi:hypothetical protein
MVLWVRVPLTPVIVTRYLPILPPQDREDVPGLVMLDGFSEHVSPDEDTLNDKVTVLVKPPSGVIVIVASQRVRL